MKIVERGLDLFLRQEDVEPTQRNIVAATFTSVGSVAAPLILAGICSNHINLAALKM